MKDVAVAYSNPDTTLGWNERLGYGSAAFGWNMVNGIIGTFLTVYFTNVAFLDAAIISTIIAVSKFFDGFACLIVGHMVDNTKSKWGKAKPWLVRMCIPFAISTVLLFYVPSSLPVAMKYVYVFVVYNLANTVCLTAIQVPYFSLLSLLTRDSYERGFLGNLQQIFQTLGNVFVNSIFTYLLVKFSNNASNYMTQRSFTLAVAVITILMLVTILITVVTTKERVGTTDDVVNSHEKQEKVETKLVIKSLLTNKYWVMMFFAMLAIFFVIIFYSIGGVYYAIYILGDMGEIGWMNNAISIAQFAIMFVTPFFMKRFGKRAIYTVGMLCLTLGFLGFGFVESSVPMMIFFNALKGIGLGMSGGMAMGMVADSILYGQLKTGVDAVGLGNAGASAAQKIGLGLGQAIFGLVLSGAGFDASLDAKGIAQPAAVETAIRMMYNYVPMIMCAVIFVMMLVFFNLEKDLKDLKVLKVEKDIID